MRCGLMQPSGSFTMEHYGLMLRWSLLLSAACSLEQSSDLMTPAALVECWGVENSLMIVISVHSLQCLQCSANVVWLLSLQLGVPVICQLSRNYIQLRRMPNHPPAVTNNIGATATNSNSWGGLGSWTFLESPMFTGASLLMTSATASKAKTHPLALPRKETLGKEPLHTTTISNIFQHMVFSVISTCCTWQEHDCSTVEIPCLVKALASGVDDLSRRRGLPKSTMWIHTEWNTKGKGKQKLDFLWWSTTSATFWLALVLQVAFPLTFRCDHSGMGDGETSMRPKKESTTRQEMPAARGQGLLYKSHLRVKEFGQTWSPSKQLTSVDLSQQVTRGH